MRPGAPRAFVGQGRAGIRRFVVGVHRLEVEVDAAVDTPLLDGRQGVPVGQAHPVVPPAVRVPRVHLFGPEFDPQRVENDVRCLGDTSTIEHAIRSLRVAFDVGYRRVVVEFLVERSQAVAGHPEQEIGGVRVRAGLLNEVDFDVGHRIERLRHGEYGRPDTELGDNAHTVLHCQQTD